MQGSNGETDLENRLMDIGRGEEMMRCVERVTRKLTLLYVKYIADGNLLYVSGNTNRGSIPSRRLGWGERWREVQEGGDICIPMADSC